MKKLFYAFAAMAVFTGCAKVAEIENTPAANEDGNLVHMTIRADAPETKTFIEKTGDKTYQPQWNATDKLGVFFDTVKDVKDAELANTSNDGEKGEFYGDVSVKNGSYRVYTYYPSDATISKESDTKIVFTVPETQYPTKDNFDSAADIAVSKADNITVSGTDLVLDNMVFGRILSTVKVTVTNSNAGVDNSEKINAVVISAEGSNLTGTISWDFESSEAAIATGNSSVTAMLTANPLDFGTSFFLLVNPTTVKASDTKPLTITIYTDAHKITKTITSMAKDLVFPLAGIAELRISTSGATVEESYVATLVKSPETISAGDEIVIAAADYYNVLMSTEQKTNNRGEVEAFQYDGDIIFIDDDAIQRFAVEPGTKASTFAFKGINGEKANNYIYAASSSSNHLKSTETKDDNASFIVSIDKNGVATITAQGTNTKNILRYNSGSSLFSCYSSGQEDVAIYKYKAGIPALATPANLMAEYSAGKIDVVWDAVSGADSYTVTCTGKDTQSGITGTSTSFSGITDGTYTITVTAISNDHSMKMDSGAASTIVIAGTPVLGKPVIGSFLQTATGFTAVISSAVDYATSYDWDLYVDSVDIANWIGSGNTTDLSFSVTFAETDITEYTPGKTYYLVITAKATGYTETASDPASFAVPDITPESLPYNNTLINGHTDFTINDISTGSLASIWSDTAYGVQANANTTTSNVETYLVSPYIDLSGVANAKLAFEHGVRYFKDMATAKTQTGLQVRIGSGTWNDLSIPTYPTSQGNDAVSNEISLLDYAGEIIQLRFKYLATSTNPGRWQIKNLSITEVVPPAHVITVNEEAGPLTVELNGNHNISTELTIASNYDWSVKSTTGLSTAYTYVKNSETKITVTPVSDNETGSKKTGIGTMILTDGTVDYTITFDQAQKVAAKEYTLTISATDFNSDSYAANNNEKTSNAVAEDDTKLPVKWTSNQIMLQSSAMQWQKSKGYVYNSTDLGKIKSVTVNSTDGTFTTYYGASEQPSSSTTLGDNDGFFQVKVGSTTGKTTSIVIVFEK